MIELQTSKHGNVYIYDTSKVNKEEFGQQREFSEEDI